METKKCSKCGRELPKSEFYRNPRPRSETKGKGGKEMKFNSQICTSREQSERLLALGLKKETADMWYPHFASTCPIPLVDETLASDDIPAWSLHRLWELFPKRIRSFQKDYFLTHFDFDDFEKVGYYTVRDGEDVYSDSTINSLIAACSVGERTDIYDALILLLTYDCVRNHFNKEYLEE